MYPSRKSFALLVLLFLIAVSEMRPGHSHAQERPGSPAKAGGEKPPDYSQEAVVIEEMTVSYRFEKDGSGAREMRLRAKVQSEAGVQGFGQLVFPYSSGHEKLEVNYVRVRKTDGATVEANESNIQDLTTTISREAPIYTDVRQKHVSVPGLRPGDVLEYKAVWKITTPVAPNHFWLAHDFFRNRIIVLSERLEVNIPAETVVKLKTEPGLDPKIVEKDGRRSYSWQQAFLKRKDPEEEKKEAAAAETDEIAAPGVQMTTFKDWSEVGQWYAALQRERMLPDEKIRARAAQIAGKSTDLEKVAALYSYVATNFRYVSLSFGQGLYQPHAASEVFANQYGDCKDKHTLLAAMLAAQGLPADTVLINSSRKIDPDIPSPAQFDHVISAIPLGKDTIWVDTTAEVAPFRLLSPQLRKKQALRIPASGPARLETTPAELPFAAAEQVDITGTVSDTGELKGHAHIRLRGDAELYFRIMFRRTPKSELKFLGQFLSALSSPGAEITEIRSDDPIATDKPFEIDYDFTSSDYLEWSSKKLSVDLPFPAVTLPAIDADTHKESKPISFGAPSEITYRLKLTLPARYQARPPVPINVTREYGEYRSSYRMEGQTLTAERSLRIRVAEIPGSRIQEYVAFHASASADSRQKLSLETDVVGAPAIPESMKVEDMLRAATTAMENENYEAAELLLNRAIEKEPKHKTARQQLGYALFAQRKFEPAIAVLREQIKINAFDDYAHYQLGRIFWQQQKYEAAEAAFRKHIEITPLDAWGHGNLGLMLIEWQKYKEALPELEQAITLSQEDEAEFQVGRGRALLKLGNSAKGLEAFERAIKLAPNPEMWNDVAYYLTLDAAQLDKAQQYAESAVSAVSTQLRNIDLDDVDLDDVTSLAAYWDTLGWVHFKKGNLDLAERYVTSAWQMTQLSEVGAHLGEINEKRGRPEDALRWYALAAVATRPVPEALESLTRLAGKEKAAALQAKAREEQVASRTISAGPLVKNEKEAIEAEFLFAITPGPARGYRTTTVKFLQGNEKLRMATGALKALRLPFTFPDETATQLVRRGKLICPPQGECRLQILNPEEFSTIE